MNVINQFVFGLQHIGLKEIGIIAAILVMDAALSGDNSIAINALVMDLPSKMRGKAIWLGMVLAAVLRVVALGFAAFIASNPWVQCLGAFYLFYLVWGHFTKEECDDGTERKKKTCLVAVLISIGFLDLSLSTDNVIAVVAMSQNFAVIVIGVLASIAMLAVAAQVVRKVMGIYPSLERAAYIILAFLGVMMLMEHGSETVVWIGDKIAGAKAIIAPLRYHIGEIGEIGGVAVIITGYVLKDIAAKHRKALHESKAIATAAVPNAVTE